MDPLTDVGVGLATEVATSALAKIKKHVAYIYNYNDNLNALQKAKGPLDAKRTDGSHFSDDAKKRLKDVSATVSQWQSDADELHQNAENIISRKDVSWFNPWSRYSLSKKACELTINIDAKVRSAPDFGASFDRTTTEGTRFNLKNFMEFGSRIRIQNEVLEVLRKGNVSMCSICGMGGIGKTMMAKKIVQIVEADHLFDKVAMVTVSQNPNLEEIQKGIIVSLGLKLDETSMLGRAKKLNDWLSDNKNLIILDDVWQHILDEDFEAIGIPLGAKRCKILITSRNLDECVKMGSLPNILVNGLAEGEAWDFFTQKAGNCDEDMGLLETARKIVAECNGLPIAIATIGTTLKGKPRGEWNDSLRKLQMSNLPGISDMEKVYSKIQVSYDLLKDPEAQSCLLLCCLFPEDYDVLVEKLVFYGKGLELFEGVGSLKEARDRVDSIVHKLKSSFLLLDGEKEGCVKLHDIVRDFSIWLSSKDENPYLIRCEEEMEKWPENFQYEKCGAISFECKKIKNSRVGLRCPNLKLLRLPFDDGSNMLPNGFFDGMEELRVVDLHVPSQLPPLTVQKALRTLLIRYYFQENLRPVYFREILCEGAMRNLEILSVTSMYLFEFPVEIGMMSKLRCLRFVNSSLDFVPPGILLNLVHLEELELPLTYIDWGRQEKRGGRFNASLDEIACLPLTSISIGLHQRSILPGNIVKSITRFQISIESNGYTDMIGFNKNVLVICSVNACNAVVKWTSSLLRQCHGLELRWVDLKYIMSQQFGGNNCYESKYFSKLKILQIKNMGRLKEIWHGPYLPNNQQPCLTSLTKIVILGCPKLKRAFPLSLTREFTQLQSMELRDCSELEEIFYEDLVDNGTQVESSIKFNAQGKQPKHIPTHQHLEERIEEVDEREADHVVVLPQLKCLYLGGMPNLRVLYNGNHAIECPSLAELKIETCDNMEGLSYGSFNAPGTKRLDFKGVGHLKNFSKWLPLGHENGMLQLKEAKIFECHEMKYFADAIEYPNFLKAFFSCLEELWIDCMDSLEEIWHGPYRSIIHSQCFCNLTQIRIYECPKLKRLFSLPVATELRQLQVMRIQLCEEMEEIFYKDQVEDGNQVVSPNVSVNASTIETTATTLLNPNDEKALLFCPTPTSFIQCLLPKRKQPKHLPSLIIEESAVGKLDEIKVDVVIVCPRLKEVYLKGTPKLRVIYNGNHAIECPSLETLIIEGCNNMEGLSYGPFIAPKTKNLTLEGVRHLKKISEWLHLEQDSRVPWLEKLWISGCDEMVYLVDAVTDRNLLKTFFSNLEKLWIMHMDSLEEIWHAPHLANIQAQPCFSHLTHISVTDCPKLKHVFPLSVVKKLIQLWNLNISRCGELEEIFYNDQVGDRNQTSSSVELNGPTFETASTLPYRQKTVEENTEEVDDAINLPQLNFLTLKDLSKLRIFYDGNNAIELPSIWELEIKGCNKIEALSHGSFKAPNLKDIAINDTKYPCQEDLNEIVKKTIIKFIRDEKNDHEEEDNNIDENEDEEKHSD